jgi:hypothetical protein
MTFDYLPATLAIILAAHGVGHMLFLVTLLGMADWRQVTDSWLITPRFGCYVTQAVGAVVWLGATACFLAAAFGLLLAQDYWRPAAEIGALISMIGLGLFWKNPPQSPVVSALVVDVLILISLLMLQWPPVALVGA